MQAIFLVLSALVSGLNGNVPTYIKIKTSANQQGGNGAGNRVLPVLSSGLFNAVVNRPQNNAVVVSSSGQPVTLQASNVQSGSINGNGMSTNAAVIGNIPNNVIVQASNSGVNSNAQTVLTNVLNNNLNANNNNGVTVATAVPATNAVLLNVGNQPSNAVLVNNGGGSAPLINAGSLPTISQPNVLQLNTVSGNIGSQANTGINSVPLVLVQDGSSTNTNVGNVGSLLMQMPVPNTVPRNQVIWNIPVSSSGVQSSSVLGNLINISPSQGNAIINANNGLATTVVSGNTNLQQGQLVNIPMASIINQPVSNLQPVNLGVVTTPVISDVVDLSNDPNDGPVINVFLQPSASDNNAATNVAVNNAANNVATNVVNNAANNEENIAENIVGQDVNTGMNGQNGGNGDNGAMVTEEPLIGGTVSLNGLPEENAENGASTNGGPLNGIGGGNGNNGATANGGTLGGIFALNGQSGENANNGATANGGPLNGIGGGNGNNGATANGGTLGGIFAPNGQPGGNANNGASVNGGPFGVPMSPNGQTVGNANNGVNGGFGGIMPLNGPPGGNGNNGPPANVGPPQSQGNGQSRSEPIPLMTPNQMFANLPFLKGRMPPPSNQQHIPPNFPMIPGSSGPAGSPGQFGPHGPPGPFGPDGSQGVFHMPAIGMKPPNKPFGPFKEKRRRVVFRKFKF